MTSPATTPPATRPGFEPFALENWQSDHEQTVTYNLADSTVEPVRLGELVPDPGEVDDLLATTLYYPEVNGAATLRETIAGLYPGSGRGADDVLVTVGASEANAILVETLCRPGDRVVVMEPGYRQVRGLARNAGCEVAGFPLDPARGWRPDLDRLAAVATPGTRLLYVCNPNNPTGYVLTADEMDRIVAIAERCGAWLVADEVYQGSEHRPAPPAPSFVGRTERVIGVHSLSKAYGLSGLRTGWLVGPRDLVGALWRRHEYAVIAGGRLDQRLAALALTEPRRTALLDRNRDAIDRGWAVLAGWLDELDGAVTLPRPAATPLAFLPYPGRRGSVEVADRIRREASVLVCPGVHFGGEGYVRLNFGFGADVVTGALAAMTPVFRDLAAEERSGEEPSRA